MVVEEGATCTGNGVTDMGAPLLFLTPFTFPFPSSEESYGTATLDDFPDK